MTRILASMLALVALSTSPAFAGDLTLRDVIELRRSGLGEDLLIAVIEADGGPIALSLADIQDLKSDGFSERLIAALVRTSAREGAQAAEGAAPVVRVQQEITNVVLPAVILVDPHAGDRRMHGRGDGRHSKTDDLDRQDGRDGHRRHRPPVQPPPASWITRQEDGKNVTSTGELRKGVPAATWVTQREPKAEEKYGSTAKPKP